ncbi:class I adenylate-forming enzyme family protein [soil metagenome]
MTWPVMTLAEAHAVMTAPGAMFEMEERSIRGIPQRVWKNGPQTLRDVFIAGRTHGEKTFIVYEGEKSSERASFEGFARASLAVADALAADGVVKGDRVVIAMRNLPEWTAAFYGALLIGAIAVPLNAWWTGAELEYALLDSGAVIAIVDAERLERMAPALPRLPDLRRVFVTRAKTDGAAGDPRIQRLEDIIGKTDDWSALPDRLLPEVNIEPEDDATIFYTSGTTGNPKGALGTHRNSVTTIGAGTFAGMRNFIRRGEPVPDPAARLTQRATIVGIPFFHVTGCHAIINPSLYAGAKMVAMHRWDTERAMALIERERVTAAGGVPTLAWQMIEHPAREKYDLSSLESVSYGGAPAASELVRRIVQVFPAAAPGTGWGMTETSATFTHHSGEDYENRPESCGPAIPVCEMKIAGDDGRELPRGEIGELWGKGPNVLKAYWRKEQATAETFVDGWVRTGDLARMDDEGFLYIVDRKKDMLIRGGENIYCAEVENALYQHPAIMDAGVIGLPHRTLGEEPAAVVTLKPGQEASEDELRAFVRERIAAFKVPVRIVMLRDTLPRNANGKIMKKELHAFF